VSQAGAGPGPPRIPCRAAWPVTPDRAVTGRWRPGLPPAAPSSRWGRSLRDRSGPWCAGGH